MLLITFFSISSLSYSQNEKIKWIDGKRMAEIELEKAKREKQDVSFVKNNKTLIPIKDSVSAIIAMERILFPVFGKESIQSQKPYNVYFVKGYWVVFGSKRRKDEAGGVFSIILDKKNSSILKISYGK